MFRNIALLLLAATLVVPARAAPPNSGFVYEEARQLLDLAINLEGVGFSPPPPPAPQPLLPMLKDWDLLVQGMDPNDGGNNAYGFGPFNSRWNLWKRKDGPVYAVVIRGTIPTMASLEEDLFTNPLRAERVTIPTLNNKTIRFRLASTRYDKLDEAPDFPVAEVHAGFSYGLASILFDEQHGLLRELQKWVPQGATLQITGHSQGAAVATLLHSFLHYACAENAYLAAAEDQKANDSYCSTFGLTGKNWQLKSYVFAQPKPGNWRYSVDLAQIAANAGHFYVVNNYDDPVPQAPFSIQYLADSFTQQEIDALSGKTRFLEIFVKLANGIRRGFSGIIDELELDDKMRKRGNISPAFANGDVKTITGSGSSLNFMPSGNIIGVRPTRKEDEGYLKWVPMSDFLREHHLWRYRQLSEQWPK